MEGGGRGAVNRGCGFTGSRGLGGPLLRLWGALGALFSQDVFCRVFGSLFAALGLHFELIFELFGSLLGA